MAANKPVLTKKNLLNARKALLEITKLLDKKNIPYHLEGGTLLGLVRDKDLLAWDYDVDISVPFEYAEQIIKLKFQFLLKGYKLSVRKSLKDVGPIKKGQYSIFKLKPIFDYVLYWFKPNHNESFVVLDIFVKTADTTHTYWQAKEKVMRVENKYYESFDTVEFQGHALKTPNHNRDYLSEKYGNWQVPVKEWDCGENELTIVQ